MSLDYRALVLQSEVTPADLKARADLVTIIETHGVPLDEVGEGRYKGLCPFHDDTNPSFDVYESETGEQKCGCFSCDAGTSNDCYDFLMKLHHWSFNEAFVEVMRLTGPDAPKRQVKPKRPAPDMTRFAETAHQNAKSGHIDIIRSLVYERRIKVPVSFLVDEMLVGTTPDGEGVVVPHYDKDGVVHGAKIRRVGNDWTPIAVRGSSLDTLYGAWRAKNHQKVILCEGESDYWTAAYIFRDEKIDIYGLPRGGAARVRPEWVGELDGRDVTLVFDADDTGRTALRTWVAALGPVRIAKLDEGKDIAATNAHQLRERVEYAVSFGLAPTPGLVEAPFGGYIRSTDENPTMISDFVLDLQRTIVLDDDGGFIFDVKLPSGRVVQLPSNVMDTDAKFRKWTNTYGHTWTGLIRDTQELLRMLHLDSIMAPHVRGTSKAGFHDGMLVFPEPVGTIGGKSWAFVPPETNSSVHRHLKLAHGKFDPSIPDVLTRLNILSVTTPLIGWTAIAPLRRTFSAFPILGVVGIAGSGKTTLVREVLASFGYNFQSTLTATTRHAVMTFAGNTNAIPVWIDEFRRGAREDTRAAFEQLIRDAWEGSSSWKGGLGEQKQALTEMKAEAPIVVTGEDAFEETSHLERMVIMNLTRNGRNREALNELVHTKRSGFGRTYLEWLIDKYQQEELPSPPEMEDRSTHARNVVRYGYELFETFVRDVFGYDIPGYDESLVALSYDEQTNVSPILTALRACENRDCKSGKVVWREGSDICVRIHDLVQEAKYLQIQLAGGANATRRELEGIFHVVEISDIFGTYLRLMPPT